MAYLAVPIQGRDEPQFKKRILSAKQAGADIVELRTDYLPSPAVSSIPTRDATIPALVSFARQHEIPAIVTCRDEKQGGAGEWDLQQRTDILVSAIRSGADYIDCEYANFVHAQTQKAIQGALSENKKTRLILSAHQFQGPFEDIERLYDEIVSVYPAAIPKLVFTAGHISDCFTAFDLLRNKETEAIVFCMGPAGTMSRILAGKYGSYLTFASANDDQATAPGQLTIETLKKTYRWNKLNEKTEIFGLIGDPVGHSLGPLVYNRCFEESGVNALYVPFLVQQDQLGFDLFMHGVLKRPWLNFGGFSVTIPHKTNALDFTGREGGLIEGLASTIGAVNTLKIGFNSILSAYNTDYAGAMGALTEAMGKNRQQMHGIKVACIGAGGDARAVVAGLTNAGAEVTIYNRTIHKAQSLAREFRCRACGLEDLDGIDASVIVNCTSIGMSPNTGVSPVPACVFKPSMTAFDTIYTPLQTQFLMDAQAAGAGIVNGAEMFIRQAMTQYRVFLGKEPDEQVIRKVVFENLKTF